MRRLNRWRRTAWWRDGGKVDNVSSGLGVAMVNQLVRHRDQLGQHLGEGRDYCGHRRIGKHHWTCWHSGTSAALVAVKCPIAGMFKRLSQFHIMVKLD